ncbi:MAG TPA: LytR C-terminal domain-containing protein [Candidatus Woesebacteria bacterium]|nr:LytR C-terminal domain-containing protein [Candidatus Woesebacteria bacterium]HPJ17156.1 LytR C-terminal domain-containing protein [Candidatus Woesebacteria bacterium]
MKIVGRIIFFLILTAALVMAGYFYWQYQQVSGNKEEKEIKRLVTEIGKIMMLPEEQPTLATVTDKEKLVSQRFFMNCQNGDKLLIFPLASKAILYRPSKKIIVEVASVQATQNQSEQSPVVLTNFKLVILNGTDTSGVAARFEKEIAGKVIGLEVTKKETATKKDYLQTVVIAVNNQAKTKADELAKTIGAKVVNLPEGEKDFGGDVVVIVGKDKQ